MEWISVCYGWWKMIIFKNNCFALKYCNTLCWLTKKTNGRYIAAILPYLVFWQKLFTYCVGFEIWILLSFNILTTCFYAHFKEKTLKYLPETSKCWVGVQWPVLPRGEKVPLQPWLADFLHQPASHSIFSYWVC